jgi:hypothetical protein
VVFHPRACVHAHVERFVNGPDKRYDSIWSDSARDCWGVAES